MSWSENSSYVDFHNQKNIAYSSNGVSRCDQCQMFIPYRSMAQHIAEHHVNQSVTDQNNDNTVYSVKNRYEKINTLFRKPFRDVHNSTFSSKMGYDRGSDAKNDVPDHCNRNDSMEMVSEVLYDDLPGLNEVKTKQMRKKLELPNDATMDLNEVAAALDEIPRESRQLVKMPKPPRKTVAEMMDSKRPPADGSASKKTPNHRSSSQMRPLDMPPLVKTSRREMSVEPNRPRIPSAYEMFNIRGSNEVRDQKPEHENGYEHRQPAPSYHDVPKHSIQCPLCSNVMHKNHFKEHLMNKHYDCSGTLAVDNDKYSKCNICGNQMPQEHIASHIERSHGSVAEANKNKDKKVDCQYCPANLHIDYMPGHLVRKHKAHENSIGVIWPQFDDEQINQVRKCLIFNSNLNLN